MPREKPSSGKKARKPKKAKKAKAPKKKPEPKKEPKKKLSKKEKKLIDERGRLMKEGDRALSALLTYPVLRKREELEENRKKLLSIYRKGDAVVKQFLLFVIHEQLSRAAEMKVMQNFAFFKRIKGEAASVVDVRRAVYRSMFNYTTSLEGLAYLLSILGEIGDDYASKVLSHHLSYYMAMEAPSLQMLRNSAIEALVECNSLYALDALLSYAKYSEKNDRFLFALSEWERKLLEMKIPQKTRDEYIEEIHSLILGEHEKSAHYR